MIWWQDDQSLPFPDELLQLADARERTADGDLYLVGQAGGSFLAEFPEARVAVDNGRYLVVSLTNDERAKAEQANSACFGVRPVPENSHVLRTVPAPRRAPTARSTITDLVSESELIGSCTVLAGFRTRHSLSSEFTSATDWARTRLQSFGFAVATQTITVGGSPSSNLVADKSGTGANRRLVIATAHLDSINISGGAGAPAPGADDNASGSAGVVEIGRVLGPQSAENDLRLILFGGEEEGLHGSRQYVAALTPADRARLDAVINMDMIGTLNVPAPTVLLEGAPVSQQLMNDLSDAANEYTSLTVQTSLNPFASDHVPFINAGLPALLTIEGSDSNNTSIHTANDTLDKVNGALAAQIVRMNVAVLARRLHINDVSAAALSAVGNATADLTGDHSADIVGFGDAGVWVSLNNGNGTFKPISKVIDNFAYLAGGWRVEKHPRFLADLTGDERSDILGFGDAGVWVSLNNGNGTFKPISKVLDNFAYDAGGWRVEKHPRFLADLTGDGRADIVGFGDAGVWVSLNNGNGTFQPATKVLDNFAYTAGGWRVEKHPRFLADLTGDGRADIVGFGDAGVWVSLNNGNGTFKPITKVLDNFAYTAGGWRVEKHPRFLADLTGDGRADILGFGDAGVWVSLNNGNGTFQPATKVLDNFAYTAGGWRVEKHPRFLADLTGDGRADIVGFGDAGVWVSLNNGNGTFQPATKVLDNFAYVAGGWRVEKHPRFLADLTGDSRADIAGFGDAGVWVSLNNGNGTLKPINKVIDNFAYTAGGWRVEKHPRFLAGRDSIGG